MSSSNEVSKSIKEHHHGRVHDPEAHRLANTVHDATNDLPDGLSAPPVKTWKQNPLVPVGILGGGIALAIGVIFAQRSSKTFSQKAMEARVLAQATAVAGMT